MQVAEHVHTGVGFQLEHWSYSEVPFKGYNPICQFIIHDYTHICTVALTTQNAIPNPTNQIRALKRTSEL